MLFANVAIAGFAALAWAARVWARSAARWALIVLAFALFALATLTRQNGLAVPLWGAGGLVAIALRASTARPRRKARAIGLGVGALACCLAIVAAANYGLAMRSDGEPAQARQLEWLRVWDMAGEVRADLDLKLPTLRHEAPARSIGLDADAG